MLLWACVLWVFASVVVALLPMQQQYIPGIGLLILAPIMIIWIATTVSIWVALFALFSFVSMFRNPLRYFWARLRGHQPELPK